MSILLHFYYFQFAQYVSIILMTLWRRYSTYFFCLYLALCVIQEVHYLLDMKVYLMGGNVDAKGSVLEWVLMKTQFWALFVVHVVLITLCCFKTCKFGYEIFYIIHNADQLENTDNLSESLLDGLEGDLARTNSEVIDQLRPVNYIDIDTETKECCICSLQFDGAINQRKMCAKQSNLEFLTLENSKGARSAAGNWQSGCDATPTNEVPVTVNGKMTTLYHGENGFIDVERWK